MVLLMCIFSISLASCKNKAQSSTNEPGTSINTEDKSNEDIKGDEENMNTKIKDEKAHKISLSQKLNSFIEESKKMPVAIDHFDDTTFRFMVERVMVSKDKKLTFKFRNGKETQV